MKKIKAVMVMAMSVILCIGITSCKKDNSVAEGGSLGSISSAIVGAWEASGHNATVTYYFEADGTARCSYYYSGSRTWSQKEHIYTSWGLKGNTVTVKGGYWSRVDSNGETDSGTNGTVTFEYNGTTLTGGTYNLNDSGDPSTVVYHKVY